MISRRPTRVRYLLGVTLLSAAYYLLIPGAVPVAADAECWAICNSGSDCDQPCTSEGSCGAYGVCNHDCSSLCDQYANCNESCYYGGWITCGEFGTCYVPPCNPDWRAYDDYLAGAMWWSEGNHCIQQYFHFLEEYDYNECESTGPTHQRESCYLYSSEERNINECHDYWGWTC
jgi:hypothetical protein